MSFNFFSRNFFMKVLEKKRIWHIFFIIFYYISKVFRQIFYLEKKSILHTDHVP